MKNITKMICIALLATTLVGCDNITSITTEDGIKKVPNKNEQKTQNENASSQDNSKVNDLEKQQVANHITRTLTNGAMTIEINADVKSPADITNVAIYHVDKVVLDEDSLNAFVRTCFGENAEEMIKSKTFIYQYPGKNGRDSLSFDKTINYTSANNKPVDPRFMTYKTEKAANQNLTLEEAVSMANKLLAEVSLTNFEIKRPIVMLPINWDEFVAGSYKTDKGYYYLGFAQMQDGIPIAGITDNVGRSAILGRGNSSAYINFGIDDSGIFEIQGNAFEITQKIIPEKLLNLEESLSSLENQLSRVILSGNENYEMNDENIMTNIPVCNIEYVYLLDINMDGILSIAPCWKFYVGTDLVDASMTSNFCVNAATGNVVVCYE